jgi:glycosyltransferase involved in cell wall biosynthesis
VTASVVICAYTMDRWAQIRAAVASARRQTLPPREIILIVDHNPELAQLARDQLDEVLIAESDQAPGLSGARNCGVAHASGDVIAFIDDDAVADPDWLERLLGRYDAPGVLGVGGAIEPSWTGGRPRGFPPEFDWVVGCTYRGLPDRPAAVRNLIGANMSLRREVIERVGGFRAGIGRVGRLPSGCEETDLCIRAAQRTPGSTFVFEPRARVVHAVPASRAGWRYFGSRCFAEGVSKARVASWTGAERSYATRTLPRGLLENTLALIRGERGALTRMAAIVAGLLVTTAGYGVGALRARAAPAA